MTCNATSTFEQCKRENINNFDFSRIITAVRATGFGWGRNVDKPDDWFLQQCITLATDVMDSAFNEAVKNNGESYCECGGFHAVALPNGAVRLQFVLESWWPECWETYEPARPPIKTYRTADSLLFTGRRRVLKLYKET
jgi:hypothetical protein